MSREIRDLYLMGYGFGVGSALFAAGAVLSALEWNPVGTAVVYALGAVCFTFAAGVQWLAAGARRPPHPLRDPDWMSAAIQFPGTIAFNIMTIRALVLAAQPGQVEYGQVWTPDVVGSALFLVASWVAWHPIARAKRHRAIAGRSKVITLANMMGSLFFAFSAWGAALLPDGEYQSPFWNNFGTFVGAACFLVGAVCLLPHARERAAAT